MAIGLRKVELQGLEMTHLRVLHALLRERSVRAAADTLCLTPSAVSHALRRLRLTLGDELFVRHSDGMVPTSRALELAPKLNQALALLNDALDAEPFDCRSSRRTFQIAALPYLGTTLIPVLLGALAREGSTAHVRARTLGTDILRGLDSGRLDLALGPFGRAPDWVATHLLREERMVVAVRRGHPLADGPLTLERLAEAAQVEIQVGDAGVNLFGGYDVSDGLEQMVTAPGQSMMRNELERRGLRYRALLTAPDNATALETVAQTDMMCLALESAARPFARAGRIVMLPPPFETAALPVRMIWNSRHGSDLGLTWLRRRIVEAAGAAAASASAAGRLRVGA